MQKLVWQNANGVELDLTSGNYGITEWEGFSNTSLNIQQQQVPFQDGGVFLDALIEQRELSVTLAMQDNNNLELRYQQRRELISALNPKLGEGYLIYTNDFISKRIKCVPQIPVFETHNSDTVGTPKASLSWTACSPYWEDLEETEVSISLGDTVTINNTGDVPAQMQIEVESSTSQDLTFTMGGKMLKVEGESTKDILIDTGIGKKQMLERNLKFNINKTPIADICIKGSDVYVCSGSVISRCKNNKWEKLYEITSTVSLNSIVYAEEKDTFVAVGSSGKIVASVGGEVWAEKTSGVSNTLYCVCYNADTNTFLAVGASGRRLLSTDTDTWTSSTGGDSVTTDIIYCSYVKPIASNVVFMALLKNGSYIQQQSNNSNWYYKHQATGTDVSGCYSPALDKTVWTYTQDGTSYIINFFTQTSPSAVVDVVENTEGIKHIQWNEAKQSFYGLTETQIYTSDYGTEWGLTELSSGGISKFVYNVDLSLYFGIYSNITTGGSFTFKKSTDMTVWENVTGNGITGAYIQDLQRCEYLNKWLLITYTTLEASADGENWEVVYSFSSSSKVRLAISEEIETVCLVIKEGSNYCIYTTSDLTTFTKTFETVYDVSFIFWFNNKFQYLGLGGNRKVTSEDGVTWSDWSNVSLVAETGPDTPRFNQIVGYIQTDTKIAFYGRDGQICYTTDMETIYRNLSGTTDDFNSGCYFKGNFLFASTAGTLRYSPDCKIFDRIPVTGIMYLRVYNGLLYADVSQTKIRKSVSGVSWEDYIDTPRMNDQLPFYIFSNEKIFVYGAQLSFYFSYVELENIINRLSNNSDMKFELDVGNNSIGFSAKTGTANAKIKYRQKYIGV